MAKKGMNLRYKSKKRERNKKKEEITREDTIKSFVMNLVYVVAFMGIIYLCILGLQKIGLFMEGYTSPSKEAASIDYEFINVNTVFTRDEKEYLVLFDNYDSEYTKDAYVNELIDKEKTRVYKVDMNKEMNAKYKGEKANKKATNVDELSINDTTLIKIKKGKIDKYLVGSEEIEEYLKK